jgi:hypothetical protein
MAVLWWGCPKRSVGIIAHLEQNSGNEREQALADFRILTTGLRNPEYSSHVSDSHYD